MVGKEKQTAAGKSFLLRIWWHSGFILARVAGQVIHALHLENVQVRKMHFAFTTTSVTPKGGNISSLKSHIFFSNKIKQYLP